MAAESETKKNGRLKRFSVFLDEDLVEKVGQKIQENRPLATKYSSVSQFVRIAILNECRQAGIEIE